MDTIVSSWLEFLRAYAGWIAMISLASFVVGLVLVPVFITRIPADYFSHSRRYSAPVSARHQVLELMIAAVKNLFGATLVLAGMLMLFMPGQGLLTLLLGLVIMNYPGKYALERWLIQRPHVLPAVNWLRVKHGHPPLKPPVPVQG